MSPDDQAKAAFVLTGDCPSCGEPFDRRYGGFDCVCQLNGHRTDACLGSDCVCGPVIAREQIARILQSQTEAQHEP